jgi:hypothetical protein
MAADATIRTAETATWATLLRMAAGRAPITAASHRIVRVMQGPAARRIRRVPLGIILTGRLRQTVAARTIAAVGRVLTPRRQAVILRQAAAILLQAVRTRLHHTLRRRLVMDRLAGDGLQAAVAEAEADQDRTAGKS